MIRAQNKGVWSDKNRSKLVICQNKGGHAAVQLSELTTRNELMSAQTALKTDQSVYYSDTPPCCFFSFCALRDLSKTVFGYHENTRSRQSDLLVTLESLESRNRKYNFSLALALWWGEEVLICLFLHHALPLRGHAFRLALNIIIP